ncbi:zinc metalloprotease [Streptomyces pacificus]|uniref:Aminopeptidase N n=2 Tax=Streptomyces pacificus TaxID=2705029 RepID=A0A6A0AQ61_9ACTN|nr:zinc metalloprotease [Streptomyces pacificus]
MIRIGGCRAGLLAAFTATLLIASMGVTTADPPVPADPVFPRLGNSGYEVESYDLEFVYRPEGQKVPVEAEAVITARSSVELQKFSLDAQKMHVKSVTVDGEDARFTLAKKKLQISPASSVAPNHVMRINVRYDVDPRGSGASGWVDTGRGFALAPQPDKAHTVFPCNDVPWDKADFTFRVSVTRGSDAVAVASGLPLKPPETRGAYTTYTYGTVHPVAPELVQIAVGRYETEEIGTVDGVPISLVLPRGAAGRFGQLDMAVEQMRWAVRELGPFPLEAYGLMPLDTDGEVPFGFHALETHTLTVYDPSYLSSTPLESVAPHMMHELVHSWFGGSVTPKTWADNWISEGHANYYGLTYRFAQGWSTNDGRHRSMESLMADFYRSGDVYRAQYGPVARPTKESLFSEQVYRGGPLVLYALEQKVGKAAFRQIERSFLAAYEGGSASTDDYIAHADRIAPGQGVKGFLESWLKGTETPPMPNHPDWKVTPPPKG